MSSVENKTDNIHSKATKMVEVDDEEIYVLRQDIRDFTPYLKYGSVSLNNANGKYIPFSLDSGEAIYYLTPKMLCPFGLVESIIPGTDNKSYKLTCSVSGYNHSDHPKHKKAVNYYDTLVALESAVTDECIKNRVEWVDDTTDENEVSEEELKSIIEATMNTTFKPSKDPKTKLPDGKYNPTQSFSLLYYGGKFNTEAYDKNRNPVDILESIEKGCSIKALASAQKITLPIGKYGIRHVIHKLKIYPPVEKVNKSAIEIDDSDSE